MTRGGKILRYLLTAALYALAGGDSLAAGQPAASDTTVAHDTSIVFFPYAYYTPETQFAVGAGGIATYYTSKDVELRPSKVVLSGRWGYVLFAAIGDVAPDITRFHAPSFKFAGGVGLRFLFNKEEKVNLRIDYGRGKDTDGIYFGLEEAF